MAVDHSRHRVVAHRLLGDAALRYRMTLTPIMNGTASPLGRYSALVASVISIIIVVATAAIHVIAFAQNRSSAGDPWLDNAALLIVGLVLGVGAIGGTAQTALQDAKAAHARLDALGAAPATTNTTT